MADEFFYTLFGLRIRSEIELPELVAAARTQSADVEIVLGRLPPVEWQDSGYLFDANGSGFVVEDVGGYWVSKGSHIVVQPSSGVPMRNVRLYLLGSAMGILLHQRGVLPLHANAIDIGGHAVAFAGRSGVGKSTLAAAFHDRGFPILADDVCVIHIDGRQAMVEPGIPRLRLSGEVLEASGRGDHQYQQSYVGDEPFRKFDVPIQGSERAVPLRAIYRLVTSDSFAIQKLEGAAATEAIFANTYRGAFIRAGGDPAAHWAASVGLVELTPIFELRRPHGFNRMAEGLDEILRHLGRLRGNMQPSSAH